MSTRFEIGGKSVPDSGLFWWSVGSISRALFFYGESRFLSEQKSATLAITTYYSLFHLSFFLIFQAPYLLDDKKRQEINQRMRQGNRDPKGAIDHEDVLVFH
jgi:hypothetical protein